MATKQEWLDYADALVDHARDIIDFAKQVKTWAKALPDDNEQVSTQGSGIETPPPPPPNP